MKTLLLLVFVALAVTPSVYAQRWRVYAPPDTRYSVASPAPLRRVRYYEGEHGIGDAWAAEEQARGSIVYVAQQSSPRPRDYAILAMDIPKKRCPLSKDVIDYLKWWIGGDDESEPTSVSDVKVNGLKGREYIYAREISPDSFTRGRIFDGGDRIYILIFKSSSVEDLSSDAATRFLNSFRLRNKGRRVKRVVNPRSTSQPTPPVATTAFQS